jgi:hypothetical protein
MARLFIDGFETRGFEAWSVVTGTIGTQVTITASPPAGMSGSYYLVLGSGTVKYNLPTSKSGIYLAFKLKWSGTSDRPIMSFYAGATLLGSLGVLYATGDIRSLWGTTEIEKTTSGNVIGATVRLIEIYYIPHISAGTFVVKVDGSTVLNSTGVKTGAATSNIDGVLFGCGNPGFTGSYDDIVMDDADWIGNTKIQGIVPTGAGTTTQWDPSTGNNYACVDETPPSDTDYVSTNTTNEIDTYAMGDLAGAITSIKCIQIQARAAYEGAPTPTKIQLGCRSGGADYFATDIAPGSTFAGIKKILETDPATGVAWTADGVNAAEFGIKAVA